MTAIHAPYRLQGTFTRGTTKVERGAMQAFIMLMSKKVFVCQKDRKSMRSLYKLITDNFLSVNPYGIHTNTN